MASDGCEMNCPRDGAMPILSRATAEKLMAHIDGSRRDELLWESIKWLARSEPGHRIYTTSIGGVEYGEGLKADIAVETGAIASSPCPFYREGGCLVCGEDPCYDQAAEWGKAPYGWLPLHFAVGWARDRVQRLVQLGIIPDAKVVYLTRNTAFPTRSPNGLVSVV